MTVTANENKNNAIVEALLPSLDGFLHTEERRLLYVGLTRARKKVYIIADPKSPSTFVNELLQPKYNINKSEEFQKVNLNMFKCPHCVTGYFHRVKAQFGDFYVCSTGFGCPVGKARVCEKCEAPLVDGRDVAICNNEACQHSIKICPQCGRPMKQRAGPYGYFWGCSGYGIEDDQCRYTQNS